MPEKWRKTTVPERFRALEIEELLRKRAGGDDEAYWYLSWRLELAAIGRNLVDQSKVRRQLFEEQNGTCPECGQALGTAKAHDVHKRERMFAKHQGYVAGNVVLLHRTCHEQVHQREPHPSSAIDEATT